MDLDTSFIIQIANRVKSYDMRLDRLSIMMDLEAVHAYSPLRLLDLLNADKANFFHDILGIRRHLNRKTKRLENCFIPRFTA